MGLEQIMSVDECVTYDIVNIINTLRTNQSDKFYNLESYYNINGDHSYVAVWTKEDEHLVIMYNYQTGTLVFGYPNDSKLMNAVSGEPIIKRFSITLKPPAAEPENLEKWQHMLYDLIQKEVSKHIDGVLKDEIRREILTTIEL
jgi:hypothetical protein